MAQHTLTSAPDLEPEELEACRLDAALERFWTDFVRVPGKKAGQPSRQFGVSALPSAEGDAQAYWLHHDHDYQHVLRFTPHSFIGHQAAENLVEAPCLFVNLTMPARFMGSLIGFAETVEVHRTRLGLPAPHYCIVTDRRRLALVWRIRPIHRPKKSDPDSHHAAWARIRFAWSMAMTKLSLAFAELGAEPLAEPTSATLALPHAVGHREVLAEDTYVYDADVDLPTLYVADVSRPLNARFDQAAFKVHRPHQSRAPNFMLSAGAWLNHPRFQEALLPKRDGERHPAATTLTCFLRWAGVEKDDALERLRSWARTNVHQRAFPYQRKASDELSELVDWAWKKLMPGGPSQRPADIRGRYSKREDVIDSVLAALCRLGALNEAWLGTVADLAKLATEASLAGAPGAERVTVSPSTLEKLLPELRKDHGLVTVAERSGSTWTTRWRLRRAPARAVRAPEPPPKPDPGLRTSLQNLSLFSVSDREVRMSLGGLAAPLPTLGLSIRGVRGGSPGDPASNSERTIEVEGVRGGAGGARDGLEGSQVGAPLASSEPPPEERRVGGGAGGDRDGSGPREPLAEGRDGAGADRGDLAASAAMRADAPSPAGFSSGVVGRAELLVDLGFSVLVLHPRTKEPVGRWRSAQSVRASKTKLRQALELEPHANLGVVTGPISGVVVVDLDSADAVRWAEENLPRTPLRVRTLRGEHWYFKHPDGPPLRTERLKFVAADVKGHGGYVVAPGSIHPDGPTYEPVGSWSLEARAGLPVFDRAWLAGEVADEALPALDDRSFGFTQLRRLREALRSGDLSFLRKKADD